MSLITYITAVIYKPRQVSFCSCIDNRVLIHSKQVTGTNAHFLITPFTDIRYRLSDDLSNILGHHFIRCYWFLCKQSPVVNTWLGKSKLFLTHLQNNKTRRMHWEEEKSWSITCLGGATSYMLYFSLRSTRFHLVSDQRKTEQRDSRFWPREKWNKSQKMKVGGGGGEGRKRLQTNPLILKTCVRLSIKGLFHTERTVWYVTRILIFSGCCLFWSARFALQCKSIFFDLFWNVRLFLRLDGRFSKSRGLSASVSFLSSPPPLRSFTCAIFRAVFDSRSSFFAPKAHRNACYAG